METVPATPPDPMTLPLRAACIHGRYEQHYLVTPPDAADGPTDTFDGDPCPGGREITDDEILKMAGTIIDTARAGTQAAADRLVALVSRFGYVE